MTALALGVKDFSETVLVDNYQKQLWLSTGYLQRQKVLQSSEEALTVLWSNDADRRGGTGNIKASYVGVLEGGL